MNTHNKSVNRTVKKLRILPPGYVQRWATYSHYANRT